MSNSYKSVQCWHKILVCYVSKLVLNTGEKKRLLISSQENTRFVEKVSVDVVSLYLCLAKFPFTLVNM